MPNEFVIKNGFISQGNSTINGTLSATTIYGNGSNLTGVVSTTRNLTINGITQNLSADTTYTVSDSNLSTSDITTNDVSTSKHGFVPKAPNDSTKYLDGTGTWSTPSGGGGIQINDLFSYQFLLMGA